MTNEERIRKWRQEQGARTALLDEDFLADFDPGEWERPQPTARAPSAEDVGPRSPGLPERLEIEDARLAILQRRRDRWRLIVRRAAIFVGAPLIAVLTYIWMVATPLYQGEAVFTVQTSADSAVSGNAGLFALGGGGSTVGDAFKAREFILSRPMMEEMEKRYGYLSHFASTQVDPITRFRSPLGLNNDPYDYYLKRVRVAVDVQEGLLRLYVQARTPEDAQRFGNGILNAAETRVNQFSDKITRDQIDALTRNVQDAERQVAESRRSLAMVQARRGELSPEQSATAIYQLISSLETQGAEAERDRNSLLSQGLTDSPLLPGLNARIAQLNSQIAEQKHRLVNPGGTSLQTATNEYESASSRKEIAQARWQSALNTLQQASLHVLEQRRYFVLIVGMSVAAFPKVVDVMTIAFCVLVALGILYGLFFAVRRALQARSVRVPFRVKEVVPRWPLR